MGLILDTSAVIGWVEAQSPALLAHLDEFAGDDVPMIHAVTLGELHRGVVEAPDEATKVQRQATLGFARDELDVLPFEDSGEQPEVFGLVAASASRKLSHNDCWIAAGAIVEQWSLVTQDRRLARQLDAIAAAPGALAGWLAARGCDLSVAYCPR